MIVDSSALVAIVLREPGWEGLVARLGGDPAPGIGAPTLAETGLLLSAKLGGKSRSVLPRLLQETRLTVVPFGEEHWPIAVEAYRRFGRGSTRPG